MARNNPIDEHYSKMSLGKRIAYHKYIYLILPVNFNNV